MIGGFLGWLNLRHVFRKGQTDDGSSGINMDLCPLNNMVNQASIQGEVTVSLPYQIELESTVESA